MAPINWSTPTVFLNLSKPYLLNSIFMYNEKRHEKPKNRKEIEENNNNTFDIVTSDIA